MPKGEVCEMILRSFDAFMKAVNSAFTLEELTGVVTKEKIAQIITDIRDGKFVSEEICLNGSDQEADKKDWQGLKIEWSEEERSGLLTIKDKDGVNWYKFNRGSLHLSRLYDLVPDLDKSEEVELKIAEEVENLDNLMKWDR